MFNERLTLYLKKEGLLVEEQNGFHKSRSCLEHIFILFIITVNRMSNNEQTFACSIDFQGAFDMINRDLLAYKLSQYGINGRFYMAIQTLCNDTTACVRINLYHTN